MQPRFFCALASCCRYRKWRTERPPQRLASVFRCHYQLSKQFNGRGAWFLSCSSGSLVWEAPIIALSGSVWVVDDISQKLPLRQWQQFDTCAWMGQRCKGTVTCDEFRDALRDVGFPASQWVHMPAMPACVHESFFMNLCRGTDAWNRRFNMEDGCAEVEIFGNFELRPLFSSFPPVTAQEVEALPSGCSWSAGHVLFAGIVVDLKIWDVKSIGFAFVLEINHVEILVSTFVSFVQAFHVRNVTVK